MSKVGQSRENVVETHSHSPGVDPFAHVREDPRWRTVDRILASETFRRSPRLKEFLRFTAERTLAGRTAELTESEIGRLVFERGDDYIPTDDSIVRSSARLLRLKLREFFQTEGSGEHWMVEIPKGGYAVQFREQAAESLPVSAPVPQVAGASRRARYAITAGAVLLVASLALNLWLWRKASAAPPVPKPSLLSTLVMRSSRATQFIMDDYAFVLLRHTASKKATLEDYANRTYTGPDFRPTRDPAFLTLWDLLSTRYLVSFGAAAAAEDALRAMPQPQKLIIRHARNVAPREFKQGNFILFGPVPNNPWTDLFENKLNFRKSSTGFVNVHPAPGELAAYVPQSSLTVNSGVGYARLAYLPNPPGQGFVLLLTGVNMVTSEAAAEFATDPARIPELLKLTGAPDLAALPHFEILLETSAVDTTPKDVHVIAYRRIE